MEETSDVRLPSQLQLMWPALQALHELGGSGRNQEINDCTAAIIGLSEAQLNVLHSGGPMSEFEYRMQWARTYLGRLGAVENSSRGVWSVTDKGQSLTEEDALSFETEVRAIYAQQRIERAKNQIEEGSTAAGEDSGSSTGEGFFNVVAAEASNWREQLLSVLQQLDPAVFERLTQRILRESGFTSVEVTGRSGDGGIDGVGVLRVSLISFKVFFQCKRYKGSVGAPAIRDFRGAMSGRTDKGLFVTTGSFTTEAKREAERDGAQVIDLIDGDGLCTLLKELSLGVATQMVEQSTVTPKWFQAI